MVRMFRTLMLLLLLLCLSAAAPRPERNEALRALAALDLRVATLAYRLSTANRERCRAQTRQSGLLIQDLAQYAGVDREAAATLFGLMDMPVIVALVPGSAAARAGLQLGDAINAVNGVPVPLATAKTGYARIADIAAQAEAGPLTLNVRRGPESHRFVIDGVPGCATRVQVVPGRKRNASADGTYVTLSSGVADEAADDDELASIIAHEMAHNILGHRAQLDAQGRSAAHIRATEIAADKLSVALLKGAGFDPRAPARFWAHFGKKTGAGIFSDGTHQRTKDRVQMLEAEAKAITQ
jgi:beta-barrel assembly-enhancing protease